MRSISVYKAILAPVLLAQGRQMRRTALRLPEAEGERTGLIEISDGQAELRLLFLGDSTMAGVGVQHQASALAVQTATILANQLACPVRWQLVAKSGVNTRQALGLANSHDLLPADVLIIALGTNDVTSQTEPSQFMADYQKLLETILPRIGANFVVISGLPPLHLTPAAPQPLRWFFGKYARLLDKALQRWIALQPHVAYVSLEWASDQTELAADGFHPGKIQYRAWADRLATQIASLLPRAVIMR